VKHESGTAVYDAGLRLEAYRFRRSFPKHFHIIYNPGDLHSCAESGAALEYWGLHIPKETMLDLTGEVTGRRMLPVFSRNVVSDPEAAWDFRALHEQIMLGSREFEREERLLLLISRLLRLCGQPVGDPASAGREAVERACAFMEGHYGERITLERLREEAGLSKSALLRAFAREKGVTPYRYLENLRVGAAKRLLEQGVPPAEAALRTGFSDQSHFTNYFSRFIGLAPGAYREMFLDKERSCHEK
jgi:AraC-like DNA-binding protein